MEKYLWSTCLVSSCCHQEGLQLQFLWAAVVANGSEGSGSLPPVLHHQYCCSWLLWQVLKVGGWCSWPCHRSSVLSASICKNKMGFDQSEFKKAVPIWGRDSTAFSCHLSQPELLQVYRSCPKMFCLSVPAVILLPPCAFPYGTGKQLV